MKRHFIRVVNISMLYTLIKTITGFFVVVADELPPIEMVNNH